MSEKSWVVIEKQSDWHWDGNSSIEIIKRVPIAAAFRLEDAQEYIAHFNGYENPYEIIEVKKI